MRLRHTLVLVTLALGVPLASPRAAHADRAVPASTEEQIGGSWFFAERETRVEIYRSADGAWQGKIVGSPRQAEIGIWALRNLRFDATKGQWKGLLAMPDAGEADITAQLRDAQTLEVVAKKLLFSKTLVWTRRG